MPVLNYSNKQWFPIVHFPNFDQFGEEKVWAEGTLFGDTYTHELNFKIKVVYVEKLYWKPPKTLFFLKGKIKRIIHKCVSTKISPTFVTFILKPFYVFVLFLFLFLMSGGPKRSKSTIKKRVRLVQIWPEITVNI